MYNHTLHHTAAEIDVGFSRIRKMLRIVVCVVLLANSYVAGNSHGEDTKIISTRIGSFKGSVRRLDVFGESKLVERYLGIPFAETAKRFQKPILKSPMTSGVYDATYFRPLCPQLNMQLGGIRNPNLEVYASTEDCLFINIVKPAVSSGDKGIPVMVWIHGGGFNFGSPHAFSGDMLSAYGDIIVITVAYRLNVFGFLSTGDEILPGNLGLWDQHIALKWIHEYISDFGGDPDNVALIGCSAGSASVVYQSMFPENKGFFQRAIGMSGSITPIWTFQPNPLINFMTFGKQIGCNVKVSKDQILQCIQSQPTDVIVDILNKPENKYIEFPMAILPSIDGHFLTADPYEIINHKTALSEEAASMLSSIDFMTGVTSGEGALNIGGFVGIHDSENFALTKEEFEGAAIPTAAKLVYGDNVPDVVTDMMIHKYRNWTNPSDINNIRQSFLDMTGDYAFDYHAKLLADWHSNLSSGNQGHGATFAYRTEALPSQHILWVPSWLSKPNHADDVTFLFGYDKGGYIAWTEPYNEDYEPEEWELQVSKLFMTLFSNFAKTG